MNVGPKYRTIYMPYCMHHVMMIVPVNADISKAEYVTYENRKKRL